MIPWSANSGICPTDNIIQVLLFKNILTGNNSGVVYWDALYSALFLTALFCCWYGIFGDE
jgi:hypothetical protein